MSGGIYPFSRDGIRPNPDGLLEIEGAAHSLVDLLRRAVAEASQHEALVDETRRVTYGELWETASRIAGGLQGRGVMPGDRVVVSLPNSVAWIEAYFGVLLVGGVVVPINTRLAEPEVEYIVADSGAKFVIRSVDDIPRGEPTIVEPGAEDVASINYTSGTTGRPKGAVHSHGGMGQGIELFARALEANVDPTVPVRTLIAVPLFHAAGLLTQLLVTIRAAGTAVVMSAFEPAGFLRAIEEEAITGTLGVPALLRMVIDDPGFADADVSSVRSLLYGGAPTPPDVVERLRVAFPTASLGNGYGLTETNNISFLTHRDAASHPGSVGFPNPGTELRIDRPDADGVGELLVRGPHLLREYWNLPAATADAFSGGWFRTGDLCRLDEDGRVYVVDRSKDMIIRGGENVYCVEVENAIIAIEGVAEVAVVGVPDEAMGERVAAVVVTRHGTTLTVDDVLERLAARLAPYKIPELVMVREEPLPRNAGGKILKSPIRSTEAWSTVPRRRAPRG